MGKKNQQPKSLKGKEGFETFYKNQFANEWEQVKEGLLSDKKHFDRPNKFHNDDSSLKAIYHMDFASIVAAKTLDVRPGDRVLDLCSAPGGKALIICEALAESGEVVLNDRSSDRRARLHRVIEEYVPEAVRERVKITGHDATKWGMYEKNAYDKIILDAPCSSERHIIHSPHHLDQWSEGRTKRLAKQQWAMITSAFDALKPGGTMIYSTCALSSYENDGVVDRLLLKRPDLVEILDIQETLGRKTQFGRLILPHDSENWGPIYYSLIKKCL